MRHCLTEENLELLVRGGAPWSRVILWGSHVRVCRACQERIRVLQEDEHFLEEVRRVTSATTESRGKDR
jgi:hypothetical protein